MRLMRASIRGSKRTVIVVDSRVSALSSEAFINRPSSCVSDQNAASFSSESKCGTWDHVVICFIGPSGAKLGVFAFVKSHLFRSHISSENHPMAFSIRPENAENAAVADGFAEIEVARFGASD